MTRLEVVVAFIDGSKLTYQDATFKTDDGGVIVYQEHLDGEPPVSHVHAHARVLLGHRDPGPHENNSSQGGGRMICSRCKTREAMILKGKQAKLCAICAIKVLDELTNGAVSKYAGLKPRKKKAR